MKYRLGFVSNSSSSSYVISCKNQQLAEYTQEAYGKLFDLFMELNPDYNGYGLDRDNYHIASVEEIAEHFKDNGMNKDDLKYNIESMERESKNGYVFLLGCCASDDGTPEYDIVNAFNEYILGCLRGRYDWQKECYKNDIELVFETRWS